MWKRLKLIHVKIAFDPFKTAFTSAALATVI
jgi:hypothetical protein